MSEVREVGTKQFGIYWWTGDRSTCKSINCVLAVERL